MSTQTLHVSCNARPIRLAFLVDKPELPTLEQVFRLNTLLWGGLFNPIVVLDGSTRRQVGRHYAYETPNYELEVELLLKEFDPDILINYSDAQLSESFAPFKNRTITKDQIRWNPWGTQDIMFFLEVWPFLHKYWREEFRFLQKPNEKFGFIDLSSADQLSTYLTARYGSYPEGNDGNRVLERNFAGGPVSYDQAFRTSFALGEWVFPIAITGLRLDAPAPSPINNYIFFLLDPENAFDIVDFWNLRASGFRVFPLPIGHYQDFALSAKSFAERSVYPVNKDVTTFPEVVKARSLDDEELDEAASWIRSFGVKTDMISKRGWVPAFGSRDDSVSPAVRVRPVTSEETSEIIVMNDGFGTLQGPLPDCEFSGPSLSENWAIELQFLGTANDESTFRFPWLHPQCDALANRRVGHGHGPTSTRVSKRGLVVMRSGARGSTWIQEPKVTELLQAYLLDAGFKYSKTSSPGLALERIIEQLGGVYAGGVFQNGGVRKIIEELADGSSMHAETARKMIHSTLRAETGRKMIHTSLSLPKDEGQREFNTILGQLISKKILRQGLFLQCDKCQRHDWYHLSDLGEEFKCKKCFHIQPVPLLDKRPWHYVSDGLFRLEGKVAGCLTALLSLFFLKLFLQREMKYVPSFEYLDGNKGAERDFAVFASEFLRDEVDVIIGECKTTQELEEKEKRDIAELGARTGAFLAIATLSDEFMNDDKAFFEELIASDKKLILLTRKHLEMSYEEMWDYRRTNRWWRSDTELLSRLTIREILGSEFADKHRLWV